MKAVKSKQGHLHLINALEARLYNMAETLGSISSHELSERDCFLADELYQKNIFNKKLKDSKYIYSINECS